MPEYIEKAAAVAVLLYNQDECCSAVIAEMEDIPAADVAPVVHGKWKIMHVGRTIKCSNCGIIFDRFVNGAQLPEHCFCGAKMDGGGKANE